MTRVGIPAARARVRPAASGRFEITTRMAQSSRPATIRSMSAWRLVPAPEIRTPAATTALIYSLRSDPSRARTRRGDAGARERSRRAPDRVHVDARRTRRHEHAGARVHRRAGGEDVVDQHDVPA